jgi:proteic killer suppression protein
MNILTLRLHELKGKRKGTSSVTIQANWRITFRFVEGNAEVDDFMIYGRSNNIVWSCTQYRSRCLFRLTSHPCTQIHWLHSGAGARAL